MEAGAALMVTKRNERRPLHKFEFGFPCNCLRCTIHNLRGRHSIFDNSLVVGLPRVNTRGESQCETAARAAFVEHVSDRLLFTMCLEN